MQRKRIPSLPPSINNAYSLGLKLNDNQTGSPSESYDLKVHNSTEKVATEKILQEIQSKLKLPSEEKDDLLLDLKEILLDRKFYSLQDKGVKRITH